MDFTLYWFMFPVSILVATTAMLSGIGGAALFTPIFFIIFPMLGPEYVLGASAAIGVALLTEVFGFSSGFVAYHRKRLVDFKSAVPFLMVSVPVAIVGAIVLQYMNRNFLTGAYGALMLALAWVMAQHTHGVHEEDIEANGDGNGNNRPRRQITAADGTVYSFYKPVQTAKGMVTAVGAFLTGLLSVGIGEVVMPQLAKANKVPIPVAAATSVFTVIVTIAAASFTQIAALIEQGGWSAVPWNVVAYTIPAVVIGGQIGPRLQGKVPQRKMETAIGVLFAVIAVAMFIVTWRSMSGAGVAAGH